MSALDQPHMNVAQEMARLRAVAEECRILGFQLLSLRQRRDGIALRLVEAGQTWRAVAEAAGFENPYIAELKRRGSATNRSER